MSQTSDLPRSVDQTPRVAGHLTSFQLVILFASFCVLSMLLVSTWAVATKNAAEKRANGNDVTAQCRAEAAAARDLVIDARDQKVQLKEVAASRLASAEADVFKLAIQGGGKTPEFATVVSAYDATSIAFDKATQALTTATAAVTSARMAYADAVTACSSTHT